MSPEYPTTRIRYEWDYEILDKYGDIIDHNFFDKCPGQPRKWQTKDADRICLVLVRYEVEGLPSDFELTGDIKLTSWAYVKNGSLPGFFDDGVKVPQRFHQELKKTTRQQVFGK
ncbi:hypothetical protein LCGC14_1562570 [marine sediment metagenome]|uniref:Uncharacterized protein n=1 Tax=marine sediment metagenome TaxID=412755 RepID=A0A0F9IM31_9ZZZZ